MALEKEIKNARLLVVDDQPANVKLLEKLLRKEGYANVTGVTDSRQVPDLYAENDYDLVLLDIRMPHLTGFDIIKLLQEKEQLRDQLANILVLTAQTDQETRLKALELGARDFLTKPFDRLEVLSRIRNLLEAHLLHREVRNHNQLLAEKVLERTRELADSRLDFIRRLGRAAEYRDNETGLHILRMSHFSELLAKAAGLPPNICDLILQASPMHDIGKLGIPDSILLKPGRLTPEEFETMKTHVEIGADLLAGSDARLLEMAREIAMNHHERWNGKGYPRGRVGEEIPLSGRIVAICDVFDALTTVRPYKAAWSLEEALAEIRAQRGKQFDPELVDLFFGIMDEIQEVQERFGEPEEQPPVASTG